MPQSQAANLLRHQEEEETDKSKQSQTERTYEKHKIAMLKGLKTQEQNNTKQNLKHIAL